MSELLWRSSNGREMVAQSAGIRLVVAPMGGHRGFQFRLIGGLRQSQGEMALASGFREQLRDAMDAAERAARNYADA